ncbi:MAG: serine/threonine-protein phosphatase [Saprospiraceae bacterium]|nr:serine/threonine-protein phosphatase [Pyrinomonadaceae bacterium]
MTDNNFQFTSAAVSDRGLSEKRPQNEDSFAELKDHGFFAVADGVGGAQAGDIASQMAIEILSEAFVNLSPDSDPEETMKIAIERANSAIFQMSHDLPQLSSMATTVVALHAVNDIATIGHVGDSRLYRVDASGQLFRETRDHSVVEEEVRAGRVTPEQALTHPSRNVISRALGAEDAVEVDLKMQIVHPGTTFLLCSDGITRHIEDWEIAALLDSNQAPAQLCQQMKEICYSRGAEDNLTAVIVRFPAEHAAENGFAETIRDMETEQVTIAAARAETAPVEELHPDAEALEFTRQEAAAIDKNDDQAYLLEDASELYIDEPEPLEKQPYTSSSVVVPAQEPAAEPITPKPAETQDTFVETENDGSFANKMLSAIALLLVGGLLGFGAHYFMSPSIVTEAPPEATPQLVAKSDNVPLTSFEEGRRIVDKDPAAYINAKAASPQDSEDYFLLGRAFLLSGKGWEAKRSFNEAKNRLAQVDAANAKTLAAEIAMALTIIETPGAAEVFTKELAAGNTGVIPNANTNVVNQPIR